VTASIGVAEWKPGTGSEDLIAKADTALLLAKARGGGTA
jgi:PleD family two-component response regulator